MKIEELPIDDLKAYARNARTHSEEQVQQIARSITEYGFTNPVLIDENNEIIAGHGRTAAARLLRMAAVPAIRLDGLSEAQKKALRIADNQLALNAGWDDEMLRLELEEIQAMDFDLDLIGFSLDELDEILNPPTDADDVECDDSEEGVEPPKNPITRPGDVWHLGDHRLVCGDSTNADDVAKLMRGEKADLWLTDPPYNVAYQGGTEEKLTIQNDNMDGESFRQFLGSAFSLAEAEMKPGAAFYIWHADAESANFRGACKDAGLTVRQGLIWSKNQMVLGRQDYQWRHEPCLYGWKDGAAHSWYSDRRQTTVLEFNKPMRNGDHPTMKPVELFAYLIGNSSRPGDIVLDSFAGSGTTVIACENLGRRARVMELDPAYCDVIVERWQSLTGRDAVRDDGWLFNDVTPAEEIV